MCRDHGLSVIEEPGKHTGLSYEDWFAEGHDIPLREKIRRYIREYIKLSDTYGDFIRLMKERDYEVKGEVLADGSDKKTAKYIRFKALGYDQFVRGCCRSLGKGFTKEEMPYRASSVTITTSARDLPIIFSSIILIFP